MAIALVSCGKDDIDPVVENDFMEYVFQWYNQPRATVEPQLLKFGFTLLGEENNRVKYILKDSVNGTLYRYEFSCSNDTIKDSQIGYAVQNATASLEKTVANFKRYTQAQNSTFASLEALQSMGGIRYKDGEDQTQTTYETYDELMSAIDQLTTHDECYFRWMVNYVDGLIAYNTAEYSNKGWMVFLIKIYKTQNID